MVLVRIIDLVVQYVKVLGGRQRVPAVVRLLAWLFLLVVLVAGIVVVVLAVKALYDYLLTIEPTTPEAQR